MSKIKKRKTDGGGGSATRGVTCILHKSGIQHLEFTAFSDIRSSAIEKLHFLHQICHKRLSLPQDSPYRMEHICRQVPENVADEDLTHVGYHRGCYQCFTKNLDRLPKSDTNPHDEASNSHSNRRSSSGSKRVFPPECIFCGKIEKRKPQRRESCIPFAVFKSPDREPSWKQIEPRALILKLTDLHRMVQGEDLFAREAQYHPSCRSDFNLKYLQHTKNIKSDTEQNRKVDAHSKAFNAVIDQIEERVIRNNEVLELSTLRRCYVDELEKTKFPNPDYTSTHLRNKLEKHDVGKIIAFAKVDPGDRGCITYTLIYNASISLGDAVAHAYRLASNDKYDDVAKLLRSSIERSFNGSEPLPWPPTATDLDVSSAEDILPHDLVKFLTTIIAGDKATEMSAQNKRLVLSLGQDICRAVTRGEWKLPKHILLCTTIRHLFRSKQLTTILSRLGHCETYDFGLELETALAKALDDVSTHLTPHIIKGEGNEVFHLEWDNLNKITTNIHGSNVVNSTGGIMIQEVKPGFEVTNQDRTLPSYERSKGRSLKINTPQTLPPVHIYNRVGPVFPAGSIFSPPPENNHSYMECLNEYRIWSLARIVGSSGEKQLVPGFGGFVSATGTAPHRKSTIDYFTPIHQPFTDYAVIRELLKRSEDATREVGQLYVLNTFDLGGCMKALPLIWKNPEQYKYHVVTPGAFHTGMNYIGMLTGRKCRGSGYAEILIEAGLVTSGCLESVLKGKAYAKALFCLKTVTEALERLLFEKFTEDETLVITNPESLLHLIETCNRENLDRTAHDQTTSRILQQYVAYEDKVEAGHLGKTATFWLRFIRHTRLLLMLLHSVKTNNLELFHKCNGDMADLFFAYDGPNYSRFLVWLEVFLTNIDLTHPGAKELLQKGGIAVARSVIPGARSAVDKTMEETFMRFAKSAGGFVGLFSLFGAYQRWCRTTSTRAQYFEKMLEMCGLMDDPDSPKAGKHRELERAEMKKSEDAVLRTMAAILNFTNPFSVVDKDRLYSLASGAPASTDVEVDVLRAEAAGRDAKKAFIKDRLQNGTAEAFYDPIKRQKLKTMELSNKTIKLTASQGKVIQYREQSDLAFMLLVKSQSLEEPLNLDELMKYPLTPVPHSLGTADGFFNKTNKAAMLHYLLEDVTDEVSIPPDALYIQDGNALFHTLTNLPPTFGDICLQVLDQMTCKKNFVFSTDSYHTDSIKAQERLRRGYSQKYIVDGPATRRPSDFKLFLANESNKLQLCQLLLRVCTGEEAASRLENCGTALVIVEGKAYQLTTTDNKVMVHEVEQLRSNQEETDTRVILYLKHAVTLGYKSAVVRTPDTDIFMILLHHAHTIDITVFLDTGTGKHRQIVNVTELAESLGEDYCGTLLGLYVFTGEDVTSAFKGKGKVGPLKKLQRQPKFHETFKRLGDEWIVLPQMMDQIEAFTCLMYGYPREKSVDAVRAIMLKKMVGVDDQLSLKSKVDLSRLPPCRDNLLAHIHRVNHRLGIYKRANQAIVNLPKPYDDCQGWEKTDGGILEPVWSCGPVLPPSLVDFLDAAVNPDVDFLTLTAGMSSNFV